MCKITDIIAGIKAVGFKIAHDSFSSAQTLPFLCWTDEGSDDFYADDSNYLDMTSYNLELYTKTKSKATEKQITDVLKDIGVTYSRNPTQWIQEEQCFATVYFFTLLD